MGPKKNLVLLLGLASAAVYFCLELNSNFAVFEGLSSADQGLSTCLVRVRQSLTSKLLGQSNTPYVSKTFLGQTEDCFAEVVGVLNENLGNVELRQIAQKINQVHKNNYQLNMKFLEEGTTENYLTDLSSNFSEIEEKAENAFNDIAVISKATKEKILNIQKLQLIILCLLSLAAIIYFACLSLVTNKIDNFRKNVIENLLKKDQAKTHLVEDLFMSFFRKIKVEPAVDLLLFYKESGEENKTYKTEEIESNVPESNLPSLQIISEKIEDVNNKLEFETATEIDQVDEDQLKLDEIIEEVVSMYSSKFFSHSIKLDLDLNSNLRIKDNSETLTQILYLLLSHASESLVPSKLEKRIKIRSAKHGDSSLIEIMNNGSGLTNEYLDPTKEDVRKLSLGTDLNICLELIKDMGGQISFENINENEKVVGEKIKLVITPSAEKGKTEKKPKGLSSIIKGKKRDILKDRSIQS